MIKMIIIILLVATSHPIPAVGVPVSLPGDVGDGEGNGQEEREQKPHLSAGCLCFYFDSCHFSFTKDTILLFRSYILWGQ